MICNVVFVGLSDDVAFVDFGEGFFGFGFGFVVLVWGYEFGVVVCGGLERCGCGCELFFFVFVFVLKGVLSLGNVLYEIEVFGERGERVRGDGVRGGDCGNVDVWEYGVVVM